MTGNVTIKKHGFFTTIQDQGRFGFSKYGVPFSGAMDKTSFGFANLILGNDANAACIEWTFQPPVLQFSEPTILTLTGGQCDAFLNDKKVEMYKQIQVRKDDMLRLGFCRKGVYGYVGIKNGFLSPQVLGSRSFLKSVTHAHKLESEDKIGYKSTTTNINKFASITLPSITTQSNVIEVYKGVEFDMLSKEQKTTLFQTEFTISNNINRMAIQLEEKFSNTLPPIITSAVLPGTVQLTPSGTMIVLMRDCQTTGGYPRILQLTEDSLNLLAQKRMQEKCSFELVGF